ncbi:MAG: CPP1-like family protein [Prochlorotrichaceae cyanobacterium]|jgi:hypothetical protein
MTEQTPYEQLGVTEDASFDEIQEARKRLMGLCGDDRQRMAAIESAYDAVLMHRLRLRQAGKIRVPDRIRFAEQTPEPDFPSQANFSPNTPPAWLKQWMDTPSPNDILWPGLVLGGLASLILFMPGLSSSALSLLILVAVSTSSYFLNRKDNRLGRGILLSIGGVIVGSLMGYGLLKLFFWSLVSAEGSFSAAQFVTAFSFLVLWWICSFLR